MVLKTVYLLKYINTNTNNNAFKSIGIDNTYIVPTREKDSVKNVASQAKNSALRKFSQHDVTPNIKSTKIERQTLTAHDRRKINVNCPLATIGHDLLHFRLLRGDTENI